MGAAGAVGGSLQILGGIASIGGTYAANKANQKIIAGNIEMVKFQGKQKKSGIRAQRDILEGQIQATAASSGVSIGSVSVDTMMEFNATQRGTELANAEIETAAGIRALRNESEVGRKMARSQMIGTGLSAAGKATGAFAG